MTQSRLALFKEKYYRSNLFVLLMYNQDISDIFRSMYLIMMLIWIVYLMIMVTKLLRIVPFSRIYVIRDIGIPFAPLKLTF